MSFNIRLDIDPVIICPYDKNHKIARSRIQRHLVKCEKNFPPDYKQECPYDATHRLFEHEMVDHVTICPMKFSYVDQDTTKLSEKTLELDVQQTNNDVWDREYATATDPFDEPLLEEIEVKQYTNVNSFRGNSMVAKRYDTKLRRPFGYSQSMMLNVSNQSLEDDTDTQSITSDMGIGRGQAVLGTSRGQNIRGFGRLYRRGFRGRLLH